MADKLTETVERRALNVSLLTEMADQLEDPDTPVLLSYQQERLVEALGWPREQARTVPGGKEVEGWLSPRTTLFSRPPRLGSSFDHSLEILPYGWSWLKRPTSDGAEFVVTDDDGREIGSCHVRRSPRHGLPTRDAAALTAAAIRAALRGSADNG